MVGERFAQPIVHNLVYCVVYFMWLFPFVVDINMYSVWIEAKNKQPRFIKTNLDMLVRQKWWGALHIER